MSPAAASLVWGLNKRVLPFHDKKPGHEIAEKRETLMREVDYATVTTSPLQTLGRGCQENALSRRFLRPGAFFVPEENG